MSDGDRLNAAIGVCLGTIGLLLAAIGVWVALEQRAATRAEQDRRAKFRVSTDSVFKHGFNGTYRLWLTNVGGRPSRGYFYIGIPKAIQGRVQVAPSPNFYQVEVQSDADTSDNPFDDPLYSHFHDDYLLLKFRADEEMEPRDRRQCATLTIDQLQEGDNQMLRRVFLWFTNTPDGRNPTRSVGKLLLANPNEHWLKYGGNAEAEKFFDASVDVIAEEGITKSP